MLAALRSPRWRREGVTIVETIAALGLLSVALVTLTQLVALAARQSRQADERRIVSQELANWMERAAVLPFEEVTDERLAEIQPAAERLEKLAQPKLTAQVSDEDGPPVARRVELAIVWTTSVGGATDELRLVAWRHAAREEAP